MKNLVAQQPKRHPDTGKVKNPQSGNFVTVEYAKRQGILEMAELETQRHFADLAEENELDDEAIDPSEEIDSILEETESVNPGEAMASPPDIPESDYPDESEFEGDDVFNEPPSIGPDNFEGVPDRDSASGNSHQGVYTGANANDGKDGIHSYEELKKKRNQKAKGPKTERSELGGLRVNHRKADSGD